MYSYDHNGQLIEISGRNSTCSYACTDLGDRTSRNVDDTTYTMGYDPENHLKSISGGSLSARYVFDGDGAKHAKQKEFLVL